jgi:hypothetical protein
LQTNRVQKFFKTIGKKSKTDFFSIFVYHVFGRFSVRGVQKHDKKSREKNDQLCYFFGLRGTNQPRRGPSGQTRSLLVVGQRIFPAAANGIQRRQTRAGMPKKQFPASKKEKRGEVGISGVYRLLLSFMGRTAFAGCIRI